MAFVATHLVSILDDTDEQDAYGDEVEASRTLHTGIPVSLIEQSDLTHREQSSRVDSTRYYRGIIGGRFRIQPGYRLQDELTKDTYVIGHIRTLGGPFGLPTRFDARRIDQK